VQQRPAESIHHLLCVFTKTPITANETHLEQTRHRSRTRNDPLKAKETHLEQKRPIPYPMYSNLQKTHKRPVATQKRPTRSERDPPRTKRTHSASCGSASSKDTQETHSNVKETH